MLHGFPLVPVMQNGVLVLGPGVAFPRPGLGVGTYGSSFCQIPWAYGGSTVTESMPANACQNRGTANDTQMMSQWWPADSQNQNRHRTRQHNTRKNCEPTVALNLVAASREGIHMQHRDAEVPSFQMAGGPWTFPKESWPVRRNPFHVQSHRSSSQEGCLGEWHTNSSPPSGPSSCHPSVVGDDVGFLDVESAFMIPTPTGSEVGAMMQSYGGHCGLEQLRATPPKNCRGGAPSAGQEIWRSPRQAAAPVLHLSQVLDRGPTSEFAAVAAATRLARELGQTHALPCTMAFSSPPEVPVGVFAGAAGDASRREVTSPALGSPELPSLGSSLHRWGVCKPCAFVHQEGCRNGMSCNFCHLCDPGVRKKQKKERLAAKRDSHKQAHKH